MSELRQSVRVLLKRPAFALLAIATLAIGIGANTAIFSVVHGVLLRPLPYPSADRLVRLWEHTSRSARVNVSYLNLRDWRERARAFDALAGYQGGPTTVLGAREPAFADAYLVTSGFFEVFQAAPALGRTFSADEMRPGGEPAVIVSDRFWRRLLSANADLSTIRLGVFGVQARVVGVMPAGFEFPAGADVWAPQEHWPDQSTRTAHNYRVFGRLNMPFDRAQPELQVIAAQLQTENPGDNDAQSITMVPLHEALTGQSRATLWLLFAAVGLVLMTACVNVAGAMVARGEERRGEMALRAALGADRQRLIRQLLLESGLLGVAGAAGGLVLGLWLLRAFLALNTLPVGGQRIGLDGWVLAFTTLLGVVTPLLFGAVPAIQAARVNLQDAVGAASRGSVAAGRGIVRHLLVAGETTLALMLVIGSVLLIHSFWNLLSVDPGFNSHGLVTIQTSVPDTKYATAEASARFYQQLLERLRAIPGVEGAGASTVPPLSGGGPSGSIGLDGAAAANSHVIADYFVVTPGYLQALEVPLVQGRVLDDRDQPGSEPVVVVNRAFVRKYLRDVNPLGHRIRYFGMDTLNEPTMTIVGVIGDVRSDTLAALPVPEAYVSYLQHPARTQSPMVVAVRPRQAASAPSAIAAIRAAVVATDADVPLTISTMDARIGESVADRRFTMAVLSTFALVALLLAAVGIYGVVSHTVAQRTGEIGVRMALGADGPMVIRMIMTSAMHPVLVGIGCGIAGSLLVATAMKDLLFGVAPLDPFALTIAAFTLIAVGAAAAIVPARRATRIDPLHAIRAT